MLETILARLRELPQGVEVGFTRKDGGGATGTLIGADEIGVVIRVGSDTNCYPWAGIQRIRFRR